MSFNRSMQNWAMNLHGKRQKPTTEASEQCLTDTTRVKYYENQSLWGIEKERPTFVTEGARRMRWFHKKMMNRAKNLHRWKRKTNSWNIKTTPSRQSTCQIPWKIYTFLMCHSEVLVSNSSGFCFLVIGLIWLILKKRY